MGGDWLREEYFTGKTFTADSNYHNPTNLRSVMQRGWRPTFLISVFAGGDSRLSEEYKRFGVLKKLPWLSFNGMRKKMNMFALTEKSLGSTGRKFSQTESFTDGIEG